ncbi:MAG: hypothetical protein ACQKBU_09835 [Verrucomicrobiales bacterium]
METVHGAAGWWLENDKVRLHLTEQAGMMAPVEFRLGDRTVSPYALAPWKPDEVEPELPALLKVLRGDFFCLPFGPQNDGPPHGETANACWEKVGGDPTSICVAQQSVDGGPRVERELFLREGESSIYCRYRISGLEGEWSYGNHPILDMSDLPEGCARLSTSAMRWSSVYDGVFSAAERNESQALKPSAEFEDLSEVPTMDGGLADLTRYPARPGHDDLVMMVNEPATPEQPFAWSAAVMDGYVWFSLKDPADFPATLFWMSNGGRRDAPWNGIHSGRIGIEEVCSHFCDRVDDSRSSKLQDQGIPTVRRFAAEQTVELRLIQSVVEVPEGFGKVKSIVADGPGRVLLVDEAGSSVSASIDWQFSITQRP